MGPLTNLTQTSVTLLPLASFGAGILGGLHCLGMCGPIVLLSARTHFQNIAYQLGRLAGYLVLSLTLSVLGQKFLWQLSNLVKKNGTLFASIVVLLGLALFLMRKNILQILQKFYLNLSPKKSWALGFLSLLLPCGFLYSVVIALTLFERPIWAMVSISSFWLGTLPWVSLLPQYLSKKLTQKLQRHTHTVAVCLSLVILIIGTMRFWHFAQNLGCQ